MVAPADAGSGEDMSSRKSSGPPKAVVFDLDGTLINSEDNYKRADAEFFQRLGIPFTEEHYRKMLGLQSREIIKWLRSDFDVSGGEEDLLKEKEGIYLAIARTSTRVYPEMLKLIRELAGRNVPMAVASGSPPDILREMLELTGISGFFSAVVSSVETGRAKPEPHVYLEAVSRLKLTPGECVAVEDSPYGVESALSAGLRCAGVPTIILPLDPVFRKTGYLVAGGIGSFTARDFLRTYFSEEPAGPDTERISEFRNEVWTEYRKKGRQFPWRETRDPYRIFVSEIMLQQTQVERGITKYREILQAFPTTASLAKAPVGEIYRVWKGLGYNRRALYLKNAAAMIVDEFGGTVPAAPLLLRRLPGVGPATAGAVAAYAWDVPAVFIETNIRRALIHAFFRDEAQVPDSKLEPILRQLVDRDDPRNWYYALTDYGAALGKGKVNANRRSTGYTRQSPFENSFRQLRGRILSEAAEKAGVNSAGFIENYGYLPEAVDRAFRELVREGFLIKEDGTYRLV